MGVFRSRSQAGRTERDHREPQLFGGDDRRRGLDGESRNMRGGRRNGRDGGGDGGSGGGNGGGGRGRTPRKKRSWLLRSVYWSLTLAIWGVIAIGGISAYFLLALPNDTLFKIPQREPGMVLLSDDGQVLAQRGSFLGDDIRFDELPDYVPQAVMAIEDRRFFSHFGIDPLGLIRAVATNFKAGGVVQGGSTITQQLAKNLFLQPDRTMQRKIQEAILALWLEHKFTKEEIFQLYLNRVYFGGGAYGVEAAAQHYFGKSIREVSLAEAAILAGLLKAPANYNPINKPKAAEERAYTVLNSMVEEKYISAEEGQKAINSPAEVVARDYLPASYYIADWVADMVPNLVGEYTESLIVETTIDPTLQGLAEASVRKHLANEGAKQNAQQGAMVVMDASGGIKAMVGGKSYKKSQYNRAIKAQRQPGSAFKPFVYLAAMEHGFSPDSVVVDGPVRFGTWAPENYSRKYSGPVTLRTALARSLNTVAAKLTMEVGPQTVADTATRLGIKSPLTSNGSIGLGTSEVNLLELTGAYAAFANGGYEAFPFVINRILTKSGTVLYERVPAQTVQAVDARAVGEMNDMMRSAIHDGTAKRAMLDGQDAAGKTGTTQDFRDAWFIGYTAHLVGGVWVGNDDNSSTKKVSGSGLPAAIWKDVMGPAHKDLPSLPLPGAPSEPVEQEPYYTQPQVARYQGPSVGEGIKNFFEGLFGGGRPSGGRAAAPPPSNRVSEDDGWNPRAVNRMDRRQQDIGGR